MWYPNVLEDIVVGGAFDPSTISDFCVAACRDGSAGRSLDILRRHLETLFAHWFTNRGKCSKHLRIIVEDFSFSGCNAMEILNRCHMFYCCGIFGQVHAVRSLQAPALIQRLRERVQYNEISYFGVCGGAMITSWMPHGCGVPPLDLLNGVHLHYDSCISSKQVVPSSNRQRCQMTTGVAVFLILTKDKVVGQSVPCIKSHNKTQHCTYICINKKNKTQHCTYI